MRHIVAMGGGGWAMEPENPLLDQYVFALPGKRKIKVCFLATASGDSEAFILRFYAAMKQRRNVSATHLGLFQRDPDPQRKLLEQDGAGSCARRCFADPLSATEGKGVNETGLRMTDKEST